jgi:hypothetical protein
MIPPIDQHHHHTHHHHHHHRRRRRIIIWSCLGVVLALIVAVVICGAIVARGVINARDNLQTAQQQLSLVASSYQAKDRTASADAYHAARTSAASAAQATDGKLWKIAEHAPWIGANLRAVRTVATQASGLLDSAQPFIDTLESIDPDHLVTNGAFDADAISRLAAQTPPVAARATQAHTALAAVNTDNLLPAVRSPYRKLTDTLASAIPGLQSAAQLAPYIPDLLGQNGTRNYLMLFQNNAEVRSLGGNPASLLLLRVDHGRLTVAAQASSSDFPFGRTDPITTIPDDVYTVFPPNVSRFEMDMTGYPDLPTVAQMAKGWWALRHTDHIDGVLTFDPIGLSHLLKATGPVTLPNGDQITGDNVVKTVLSDVYAKYPVPAQQDAYFAAAAASVFNALTTKSVNFGQLVGALQTSVSERRLHFWSENADIQKFIAQDDALAGTIGDDTADTARIGTYLWDTTGSKIDYHITSASAATAQVCNSSQRTTYTVDVTVTSTITPAQAWQLPEYVLPNGPKSQRRFGTDVYVFGPQHSTFQKMTVVKGAAAQSLQQQGATLGRPAARANLQMAFGTSATLRFTFVSTGTAGPKSLDLLTTPMVHPAQTTTKVEDACQ